MNTDASNVEDINMHHIRERLSMSCIASFEEWFNISRNRSFTLLKNDRDFRGKVRFCGGVRVHIIIDDKIVIYGSPRSCVRHFTWFPLLRRPVVNIPFWVVWWASAHHKSPSSWLLLIQRAQRYFWTFRFGFTRAFRCSRGKHVRIPHAVSRDQIHHWLWFCCDSFFTCIFLCSFRHPFQTIGGTEMANVQQTQKMMKFITSEISPWSVCLRVGSWCQCIWFGSWCPNWCYQTTIQEQLCWNWKNVPL